MPTLTQLGTEYNYDVICQDVIREGDLIVSSTAIREALSLGDVAPRQAPHGRPFRLSGPVVVGDKRGRLLASPPPTSKSHPDRAFLADGIYATRALLDNRHLDSITYVGSKPTFEGETRATEVYIFDFDEDIYGQHLSVDFLALVRSDMRFSGVPELIEQMNNDVVAARKCPGRESQLMTKQKYVHLFNRGVAEVIRQQELEDLLDEGRPLRLKMGFDPSRSDIHLGHTVGLRKLRQFQELGHQVILIVGDWTAQIGDPSGQSATRQMLSAEQVRENAQTYMEQFFKVVDKDRTEVRWQSDWFGKFTLTEVISLTSRFTVAQILAREDFSNRFKANRPIAITELLYPPPTGL